ncbi:T9SS type A sorting domain-containing protein [Gracilimonas tropica]|uniref:T9SS type A sorting domain-containing protein n=1 Tax=Gracilimonas tropica TaxID=454600 RepID=UPI00039BC26E|nr:T9SS type A sorting domain-containing protein [Gracilimonas tropica]
MMRTTILLLMFMILANGKALAQQEAYTQQQEIQKKSYPVHVSDKLNNKEFMLKLNKLPNKAKSLLKSQVVVDQVGDEKTFFVSNLETDEFDEKEFRLIKKGNYTQIWLEIDEINNGHLTNDVADSLFKYLEDSSNPNSFNPNKGIIELSNEILGSPPNYDGDGLVDFLVTDIKDGWDPEEGGGYTAGFFYGVDQFPDATAQSIGARSNERDILYIDSYPGIYSNGQINAKGPLGTLSHEYQHIIHYNYNDRAGNNEFTFINEAQSNFAALLNGYFPHNSIGDYLSDTNVPIFRWNRSGNVLPDYGRAAAFTSYLWSQFGFENSGLLTQEPLSGADGVNSVLSDLGSGLNFGDLLVNWGVANLINDTDVDSRYGYSHPFLNSIKADVAFSEPNLSNEVIEVEAGGIEYVGFTQVKNFQGSVSYSNLNAEAVLVTKKGDAIEVEQLTNGSFSLNQANEVYDEVYLMLVNKSPSDDEAIDSETISFTISAEGEKSFEFSTYGTYSDTPKYYWEIPYSAGSENMLGFSNKFESEINAQLHFVEIYLVSGTNSDGEPIGVKGNGTLDISFYSDQNGTPGQLVKTKSVDFTELGNGWQQIDVRDWNIEVTAGETFHIVYKANVDNVSTNKIPLRLDDGTGEQGVTNLIYSVSGFDPMFTDDASNGEYGVWNNIVLAEEVVTSNENQVSEKPQRISLLQNYPNPFNPTTTIRYSLDHAQTVRMDVFNMQGQKVATILKDQNQAAGEHSVTFDASTLSSGVYMYRLSTANKSFTRQMVLIK